MAKGSSNGKVEDLHPFDALVKKFRKTGKAFVRIEDFNGQPQAAEAYMKAVQMSARKKGTVKVTEKRVTLVAD